MQVSLEAIKFNHDPTFVKTGAIKLRRNETVVIDVPEWIRNGPQFSPAAYVSKEVPLPLTIEASFSCDDAAVTSLQVQALSPEATNVLGAIPRHDVTFTGLQSGFIPIELPNATIRNAPIGIHDITWQWQFSVDSRNWRDFQTTKHRIYAVAACPSEPWIPRPQPSAPPDIHNPWTDVLDHACEWAAGEDDPDEAAKRVTENVYDLGKTLVKYASGESYAFSKFECTEFLKLLNTGVGAKTVNCDDCATVVSTFANILGCDLHQSGMGETFCTNRIRLIGAAPTDWKATAFLHHAVAWKNLCEANDPLFDGCLQLDNDGNPEIPPEDAIQPTNLKFGDFGDKAYKFCLVKKDAFCQPLPGSLQYGRRRRRLGHGFLADAVILEESVIDNLKQIYEFHTWPPVICAEVGEFQPEILFPEWELHKCEQLEDARFKNVVIMLFNRPSPGVQELLAVNIYECRETTDPNNFLLQALGSFERLTITRLKDNDKDKLIGDISFQEVGGVAVLFRRGRFVNVVRSAGRQSISVVRFAALLDLFLIS